MIEWKEYDKSKPPQLNTEMLVFTNDGHAVVAVLEKCEYWEYVWTDTREEMGVYDVTHYAEIKPPDKREEE